MIPMNLCKQRKMTLRRKLGKQLIAKARLRLVVCQFCALIQIIYLYRRLLVQVRLIICQICTLLPMIWCRMRVPAHLRLLWCRIVICCRRREEFNCPSTWLFILRSTDEGKWSNEDLLGKLLQAYRDSLCDGYGEGSRRNHVKCRRPIFCKLLASCPKQQKSAVCSSFNGYVYDWPPRMCRCVPTLHWHVKSATAAYKDSKIIVALVCGYLLIFIFQ